MYELSVQNDPPTRTLTRYRCVGPCFSCTAHRYRPNVRTPRRAGQEQDPGASITERRSRIRRPKHQLARERLCSSRIMERNPESAPTGRGCHPKRNLDCFKNGGLRTSALKPGAEYRHESIHTPAQARKTRAPRRRHVTAAETQLSAEFRIKPGAGNRDAPTYTPAQAQKRSPVRREGGRSEVKGKSSKRLKARAIFPSSAARPPA